MQSLKVARTCVAVSYLTISLLTSIPVVLKWALISAQGPCISSHENSRYIHKRYVHRCSSHSGMSEEHLMVPSMSVRMSCL
jgi:hypothetical protein